MAFDSRDTLMSTPMEEFKEPQLLPNGHYYAQIMRNANDLVGEKKTDVIDFFCQLTEAHSDVDQSAIAGLDLREFELRARFFITKNAMYRLRDFFTSLGFNPSTPADAIVPETTGRKVYLTVVTTSITRNGRTRQFNNIDEIVGVPDEVVSLDSDETPVESEPRRRRA